MLFFFGECGVDGEDCDFVDDVFQQFDQVFGVRCSFEDCDWFFCMFVFVVEGVVECCCVLELLQFWECGQVVGDVCGEDYVVVVEFGFVGEVYVECVFVCFDMVDVGILDFYVVVGGEFVLIGCLEFCWWGVVFVDYVVYVQDGFVVVFVGVEQQC